VELTCPIAAADYILAVDDAVEWHRQNLEKNGTTHYSVLRVLGARALAHIQVFCCLLVVPKTCLDFVVLVLHCLDLHDATRTKCNQSQPNISILAK